MEPLTSLLTSVRIVKSIHDFAFDEAKSLGKSGTESGLKSLVGKFRPNEKEKAAKIAVTLFSNAWSTELARVSNFSAALPGYEDQLVKLIEVATPDIAEWMHPGSSTNDIEFLHRTWNEVCDSAIVLPQDFDWGNVGASFDEAVRLEFINNSNLREMYDTVLRERTTDAVIRTALAVEALTGEEAEPDLELYKKYLLEKKCGSLQLATLEVAGQPIDHRIALWSVFVPQSARGSAPILGLPPEIVRQLREEGHMNDMGEDSSKELITKYQATPIRPILELIEPYSNSGRHCVITGDPGSGKSSLLKFICLNWARENLGPIPVLVDLKEYGKERQGVAKFCASHPTMPGFPETIVNSWLALGKAALYLDGLDEIFDPSDRAAVIDEIIVLSSKFPRANIYITSRKVGYQPEKLTNASFLHATIEDFDRVQISEFLFKWHSLMESNESKAIFLRDRLNRAIKDNSSIRELAGNPLLLTMMAILNRSQELPRNRVTLYQKASEVLLHDWDADRALASEVSLDREDKKKMLLDLAGEMQQGSGGLASNLIERARIVRRFKESLDELDFPNSRASALALVKQMEERNFILAYAGAGRFSFVHRTFLEFFCATWFTDRLSHKEGSPLYISLDVLIDEVLRKHWEDDRWREVIRLITGMIHETKAEELIKFLLSQNEKDGRIESLLFAAECLSEVRLRKGLLKTDKALWEKLVAFVQRTPEQSEILLDDKGPAAVSVLLLAWRTESVPLLRKIAETGYSPELRTAAVLGVARDAKSDPATPIWLKFQIEENTDDATRGKAMMELGDWADDPKIMEWIMQKITDSSIREVRQSAASTLSFRENRTDELKELLMERLFSDPDPNVRAMIAVNLGFAWREDETVLNRILDAFNAENVHTYRVLLLISLSFNYKETLAVKNLLNEIEDGQDEGLKQIAKAVFYPD